MASLIPGHELLSVQYNSDAGEILVHASSCAHILCNSGVNPGINLGGTVIRQLQRIEARSADPILYLDSF